FASQTVSEGPTNPEDIASSITRYERSVARFELAGGPYETRLSEELLALGSLYQRAGEHEKALGIFERASHINRVNGGLFSLEQIPIIEKTIETYLARGDLVSADAQQEYLFYLQRKNYGDRSI